MGVVLFVRVSEIVFFAVSFAVLCAGEPAVVFVFGLGWIVLVRLLCGRRGAVRRRRRLRMLLR